MTFLKSISFDTDRQNPFPFNIAAVKYAKNINLDNRVTIVVGDNGCGKSTLLECLAYNLQTPLIGGSTRSHSGFEAAEILMPYLKIEWNRQISEGFFFRAEDFSDFINSVVNEKNKITDSLRELEGKVDDSVIQQISESMNFSLHQMRKQYGDNMQAYSHGEAFLKVIETRINKKGIYLLDEPEAALSPLKQLSLIAFILEVLKDKNSQFIIATHSPIIMGIPDAIIYEIQDDKILQVPYRETKHFQITKSFLDNPDSYLRHL